MKQERVFHPQDANADAKAIDMLTADAKHFGPPH
jgi:hypothetical protein